MNTRKAYVILVLISIFLSASVLFLAFRQINSNNHKFCDLFEFALTAQTTKPHPSKDPKLQANYEGYIKLVHLNQSLGCQK